MATEKRVIDGTEVKETDRSERRTGAASSTVKTFKPFETCGVCGEEYAADEITWDDNDRPHCPGCGALVSEPDT